MSKNISDEKFSIFQFIIIILSIYLLGSLIASTFFKLPNAVLQLLDLIDNGICIIFLLDFLNRFVRADNKLKFLRWGWIDLVSSIPSLNYFRAGRLLRLIRLLRLLRAFRSTKMLYQFLFRKKTHGAFATASIVAVFIIIFSSIAILQVEDAPNSNIKTAENALWWSYTTITTVGYGDYYPVTPEGKIIAVMLMTVGVGLFGTFSGFIASWFLKKDEPEILPKSNNVFLSNEELHIENKPSKVESFES